VTRELRKAGAACLSLTTQFISKEFAMNQGNIDAINNSWRGFIASFTNNSRFVLLLDLPNSGYALFGEAQSHGLVILPGDSIPQYFGGNSAGMGVEAYFRFGVWDCGKVFAALPDQSPTDKAAKRSWVLTRMRTDQFDTSRIITSVGSESSPPQRLSNLFVMFEVPKVGANTICVAESNPADQLWRLFTSDNSHRFIVDKKTEGTHHDIPKAVHLSGTFFIASGKQNVEAGITITDGPGFI
jgi:hypothetical protein